MQRMHRPALDRPPPWQAYTPTAGRSAPPVGVQPLGWLRRRERRRAGLARPDRPPHRLREDRSAWCGTDLPMAAIRDGTADPRRTLYGTGPEPPGVDLKGGGRRFPSA